jgi:D-alanyl-D-alanine carboxypeptidase
MKQKLLLTIFVAVCLTVLPLGKNFAVAQNYGALNPAAFIESLKTELSLLKMLLANMNAKNAINSPAYIAVDLETGKTLLSKNPEQARPAASITKMMTAAIARKH